MTAPTPTNNGLPEGKPLPKRMIYDGLNCYPEISFPEWAVEKEGWKYVEPMPPGSRERLRELEAFVKIIDQYNNPIGYLKEKARALYKETK